MAKKPSPDSQLKSIRQQIDKIDLQLHDLINQRATCAQQVAKAKQEAIAQGVKALYYRPEREAQVLREVIARNKGPLGNKEVARLFREIMSACLALEEPLKVAYLGPEGTFTQAAALKHFGHSVNAQPMAAIDEVFREVESGSVHYGVVPIENSTEGMVNHTLDSFKQTTLRICGEVELRTHHHLLTKTDKAVIQKIYSHQQSLAQCRKWLDAHYPKAERIAVSSNAEAAKLASKEKGSAAIAGEMAAELYGLKIRARNIEDHAHNSTRFLIIGDQDAGKSGDDKTSIIVSTRDKPGALYHLLEPFRKHNINLTRLETRPSLTHKWAYVFFIDFAGHQDDKVVQTVLQELAAETEEIKILGSYPRAVM
jgi:chorismate mutase/prephenate dehydratase